MTAADIAILDQILRSVRFAICRGDYKHKQDKVEGKHKFSSGSAGSHSMITGYRLHLCLHKIRFT